MDSGLSAGKIYQSNLVGRAGGAGRCEPRRAGRDLVGIRWVGGTSTWREQRWHWYETKPVRLRMVGRNGTGKHRRRIFTGRAGVAVSPVSILHLQLPAVQPGHCALLIYSSV